MSILKKALYVSVSAAMAFASVATVMAEGEETAETPVTPTVTAEEFLADLADGYAEAGAWKVEAVKGKENVYHMDEETEALPGGANDADGNMNNPSSIYFVVGETEVLIVDGGNPSGVGSQKEADAKMIVEAMVGEKDAYFAFTHNHGDHVGLVLNETVAENINVKGVYVGSEDNSGYLGPAIAKYDVTNLGSGEGETMEFTVGGRTYQVVEAHAHTEGSVCFVDVENEVVFTGDSVGSGFVWALWETGPNPLGVLEAAVTELQGYVGQMASPRILAGHRWQQFWENNPQRPNEMSIQYLNDMNAVLSGLQNGTAKKEDYSAWEGAIEVSADGCKAKVDTTPELVEKYLDAVNSYNAAENVWVFSEAASLSIETVNNTNAPKFMIWTDEAMTKEEAKAFIDELGVSDIIAETASMAIVIGPQGEDYGEEDVAVAMDIMGGKLGPTTNLNFVGFGKGATFVNKYMSQKNWGVAGVAVIGGEGGTVPAYSVPAYVSNSKGAAEAYKTANKATKAVEGAAITTTVNPDCRFEIVVENTAEETDAEAFQNAWETVLSRFGRIGNIAPEGQAVGTWYWNPNTVEKTYMLFDSVDCINDEFTRDVVLSDFDGDGIDSLYYVYTPKCVEGAKEGTVPAVFLMHGNTNDPRTQYDTSGWAQIAAREGIILVCPEWQGHTYQGYSYDPMTNDANQTPGSDFTKCVAEVVANYPLVDASRLYISGLSAGCRNTMNNVMVNTGLFAAGAGQSGPFKYSDEAEAQIREVIDQNKEALDVALIVFAGDRDEYLGDWDRLEGSGGEQISKMLATLNDVEIETGVEEFSKLYGVKWDTYNENIENEGLCQIIGGTFENEKGVEVSMNRILSWGHWNYAPDAQMMWDFMKKYSRNLETGELIRADKQVEPQPETPEVKPETKPETKPQTGVNTGDGFNPGIIGGVAVAGAALAAAVWFTLKNKK